MTEKENKQKLGGSIIIGGFVFMAMMLIFICCNPLVSYAETGTLGYETPKIYCTYEQNGAEVDGNALAAGTYDVSFVLSGVQNLSVIEITASYDETQVTVGSSPSSLVSDDAANALDSMGYVLSGGNIVFGFVSVNEACSSLAADDQVLATVEMTFASDCDAEQYIKFSENPNLTFAQVDYGDGYDDEYALVESYDGYSGKLSYMESDVTPGGYSVNGSLVIMTNSNGSTNGVAVYDECTIDVFKDEAKTEKFGTFTSIVSLDENDKTVNKFSIDNLESGATYYATVTSKYSINRDDIVIRINNSDISSVEIPIVVCDFNNDGYITVADTGIVFTNISGDAKYCDLNGDSNVTVADTGVVFACTGIKSYNGFTIE